MITVNKLQRILCLLLTVLLLVQAPLLAMAEGEQADAEPAEFQAPRN
jgi:hypothetical protein